MPELPPKSTYSRKKKHECQSKRKLIWQISRFNGRSPNIFGMDKVGQIYIPNHLMTLFYPSFQWIIQSYDIFINKKKIKNKGCDVIWMSKCAQIHLHICSGVWILSKYAPLEIFGAFAYRSRHISGLSILWLKNSHANSLRPFKFNVAVLQLRQLDFNGLITVYSLKY